MENQEQELQSGLKLWADVGVSIGKSVDQNTEIMKKWQSLQENTPFTYQVVTNGYANSNGSVLLNLGSPDQGTYWEVQMVSIGGTDVNVTAAGSAGLYVSGSSNVTGGASNLNDYAQYLPNVGFYGSKKLIIKDGEYLLINVFGGTSGQNYVATARVSVIEDRAARGKAVTTL